MPGPVAELCSRHHYPDALREALEQLVDAAHEAYPSLESFILCGSAATGDYVHAVVDGEVMLVSDLDMMLFADKRGARPERLEEAVADIQMRHPSPLFQVDIAVSPKSALASVEARYQMVETRMAGAVLAGRDVREHFPSAFDGRAARRSFLGNLWKPVLYWTPAGGAYDLVYQQVAARLFLDLPLLVCAGRGECIPGHRARAEAYFAAPDRQGLFSGKLRERVRWALDRRSRPSTERAGLEREVADFAFEVAEALDARGPMPRTPDPALVRRLAQWLPPRTLRRIGGEFRALVRDPRRPDLDVGWLVRNKEATGGAALLGLLAHLAEAGSDPDATDPPVEVRKRLAEYARQAALARKDDEAPLDFLFRLKRAYRDGLATLYPSLGKQQPGIDPLFRSPRQPSRPPHE